MVTPSAAYTANVTALAPENWRERNTSSGTIGCTDRASTTRNSASASAPATNATSGAPDHADPGPSMSP